MFTIRCFKCGWAWSLNAAEAAAALDAAYAEGHTKVHMIECPKCRRANKVSVKQLRRYAPRDWEPSSPKPKKETQSKSED